MNYSARAVSQLLIIFLLFFSTTLFAQTNWEGDSDNDWNNGLNWAGDVMPADATDVVIDATIYTNAPSITGNSTFSPGKVTIQNGGVLTISADLTTSDNFTVDGGDATNPTVTMSAGTLAITGGNKKKVDIKKGGVFTLSGGTITSEGDFKVDGGGNNSTKMNMSGGSVTIDDKADIKKRGVFTLSGGTFISTGDFQVDDGSFFINEDDGTSTVTASAKFISKTGGGKSLTQMSAGTFTVNGNFELDANKTVGNGSTTVNVAGGTFTANAQTLYKKLEADSAVLKVSGGTATLVGIVEEDPANDGSIDLVVESGTLIFQNNLVMDEADDQMTQTGGTIQFEGGDKDWTNNGSFTSTGGNVTFNDATKTELIGTGTFNFFDVVINSGKSSNQLTANINVAGDWTNSGGTFNEGVTKVTFNGSGDQTITNTSVETFYEFALDKSAGELILDDNVIIDNTLTMLTGQINTGANRLTLGTGTGNEGTLTYTDGQIEGEFERWINTTSTDYLFPLGIGSATGMTLNFTNLTGGSVIGEFFNTDPGDPNTVLPLAEASLSIDPQFPEGYWDVTAANSLASTDYNVRVNPVGFATFYKGATTRLLKRTNGSSDWVLDGTHVKYDIMAVEAGRDNLTTGIATAQYGIADVDCGEPTTTDIIGVKSTCTNAADAPYSVTDTPGSTYNWTITGGTQDLGGTTNSITVDWGATGGDAIVQVEEVTSCGNNKFKTVTVVLEPVPTSVISGNAAPCPGTPETYSVTNTIGYTYTWVITGGTQTSGGTTNSITVEWDVSNASADVQVTASSPSCGDAPAVNLAVVVAGYTSSAVEQPNTTPVTQFSSNAEIIEIQIVQAAGGCSDTVTQFNFDTTGDEGTDNPGTNITSAKVFYTGSTQGFATDTQFGSVASPNGTFSITGSQVLEAGATNYFYLAYDVPLTATVAERLDAQLVSFQFGSIIKTDMTTPSPAFHRDIAALTIYHSFGTGNWTDGSKWSLDGGTSACTCEPNGSGLAIIQSGHVITVNAVRTVDHLTIESGGQLAGGLFAITILDQLNTQGTGFFSLIEDLTVSGPATLSGTGSSSNSQKMTFSNVLDVGSGTTLTTTTQDLLVKGNLVVDGTIAVSGKKKLKLDGVGATTISGAGFITSLDSAAQFEIKTGNKTILAGTDLTISPEIKVNTANVYNYGTITTIESAVLKQGTIDGGKATDTWFNYTGSTVNYGGTLLFFRNKGFLDASATGNTVNYNRDGVQQIAGMTYYDVIVTSSSGTRIKTLDGDAIIGGDLTISGTTQLDNGILSNSITLAGNWINTSSIGDSFVEADGLVTLNGSAAQAITNTSGETFNNLTINNSVAGDAITFNDPVAVSTALTLTDGVILTTATDKLSMATAATSSGYSDASFVNGPMTYNSITNSTVTFPVGKNSELHRIDLTVDGTSSNYTTEYINSDANALGHTLPGTLDKVSGYGYWDLSRDVGGTVTTAAVDLYYNASDDVSDAPNLRVAKDDGAGTWLDLGGTGSAVPAGNIASATNFTSFSSFSLGNNIGGANALPVELVYFKGKLLPKGVVLEWQTASELNNDFFEIEVSSDGENYTTMANVRGQGTTTKVNNYEFVDRYPASGLNYYRLRQVDYNGDFEYSNIISVLNDAPPKLYYSAYPQPASTHLTLQIRGIDETNVMNLFIYNINGRIIKHITVDPKTTQLPVDISAFANGLYLVRLNQAAQAFHGRLLIQK